MDYITLRLMTQKVDSKRINNAVSKNNIKLVSSQDIGNNHLYICDVKSASSNDKYSVAVNFLKTNTDKLAQEKFKAKEQDIEVYCSCTDFQYIFAPYNYNNDCLYGPKPPEYHKKTDRQSKNPKGYPGLCKHLLGVCEYLFNEVIK